MGPRRTEKDQRRVWAHQCKLLTSLSPLHLSFLRGGFIFHFGLVVEDTDILSDSQYSALRALLYHAAISRGASVHFGARVVSLNVLSRFPSVTLECGDSIYADIVVGADGVDGITRRHFVTSTFDSTGVLDKEKGIWKSSKDHNVRRSVEAEEEGLNISRCARIVK